MRLTDKIFDLFTDRIWTIDTSACPKGYAALVRHIKVLRITIDTFTQNRMGFQCVALSYFVTLAIIPLIALIFAITGDLGLSDKISEILHRFFANSPEYIDILTTKANELLESAKGGGLGLASALTLIWAVLWMMFQVERVFNNVWGIRKIPRNVFKRFGFYLLVLVLTPFLILLFGTGIAYYTNLTNLIGLDLSEIRFLPKVLGYTGFYAVSVLTLSVMYKFIPAAKVKYRYALKSALITAVFFVIFQYIYLETQMFVGRLNSVYGVIAAIPLFLMWLNLSWQIIILGAELCYGYHNVDRYKVLEWDSENK